MGWSDAKKWWMDLAKSLVSFACISAATLFVVNNYTAKRDATQYLTKLELERLNKVSDEIAAATSEYLGDAYDAYREREQACRAYLDAGPLQDAGACYADEKASTGSPLCGDVNDGGEATEPILCSCVENRGQGGSRKFLPYGSADKPPNVRKYEDVSYGRTQRAMDAARAWYPELKREIDAWEEVVCAMYEAYFSLEGEKTFGAKRQMAKKCATAVTATLRAVHNECIRQYRNAPHDALGCLSHDKF